MKQQHAVLLTVSVALLAGACRDSTAPLTPSVALGTFVSVGTSVSMGWRDDGVTATSQATSWPAQMAAAAGVSFTQPLIDAPGCQPPLASPLGSFKRADNTSVATASTVCAALKTGSVAGSQNLSVENATALEALTATPATATLGRGPVTSRVLPAGMTQLTAMRALQPTFVSVELGGNEILRAQVGVVAAGVTYTPIADFKTSYAKVIDSVKVTGARAVLVGMPTDLRKFPTIRTGSELYADRAAFAALNVTVSADCDASPNYIFVRGKVLTAVGTAAVYAANGLGAYTLSCADVPGQQDYVLTPSDITFLNDLAKQMDDYIAAKATENGYAYFSLGALYDVAKTGVPFSVSTMVGTATPYGALVSLDGVHPSAAGSTVLARAAIAAINTRYGLTISTIP